MRRSLTILIVMMLSVFFTASCSGQANDSHSFVVTGSTSVQPYVEKLAEVYERQHPDYIIDVQGGGSSAGIQAVQSGIAEIGMSSRNLKDEEKHLWSIEIAKDGLAIIVNPNNPVKDLSIEDLRRIYAAEYVNWNQLGGQDAKIHIVTREEGSGTRGAFEDLVMGDLRITPRAIVLNSNGAVRQLVADDNSAIGYISLGLVETGERPVKALRMNGVAASANNVQNGDYALFRSFLFVAQEKPTGNVMHFIDFIRSPEGQKIMSDEGLIPEFGIQND